MYVLIRVSAGVLYQCF